MQAQSINRVVRLLAVLSLSTVVLTGCDSWDGGGDEIPQTAQASFDATHYWPSYGEDIKSVGNQHFTFEVQKVDDGDYDVLIRSHSLKAAFNGLSSGDAYDYDWAGPSEYDFKGEVGATRALQETVMLKNERTGQEAEGLVIATVEIMQGGGVSFTVKDVISLP
jgi:hypothetical protein